MSLSYSLGSNKVYPHLLESIVPFEGCAYILCSRSPCAVLESSLILYTHSQKSSRLTPALKWSLHYFLYLEDAIFAFLMVPTSFELIKKWLSKSRRASAFSYPKSVHLPSHVEFCLSFSSQWLPPFLRCWGKYSVRTIMVKIGYPV